MGTFPLGFECRPLGSEAPIQVLLLGFTEAPIEVLLPFTTLPTFYRLPVVGFRNPCLWIYHVPFVRVLVTLQGFL